MDSAKRARLQSFRVIVSETIMVLTVIITVVILAFIVSGYWINSDFTLERQGMLQVYSSPTGANVSVDGDSPWFQRTNTSKVLSSGEHEIILTKDGYDTWSKVVNIQEGLLYRLHYPRLFLKERKSEIVYDAKATTYATISPNRKLILLLNNTTMWTLLNLDSDNPKPSNIDISEVLTSVSLAPGATSGLFTGEVLSADWDYNNEHVLIHVSFDNNDEWALLNVKNPSDSINLTREFATNFDDIKIFDNSASRLLAIRDQNLHQIDVSRRQISAVLVEGIENYDFYESELVFVSKKRVYTKKIDSGEPAIVTPVSNPTIQVLAGKFYDDNYIFVIDGDKLTVYQQNLLEPIFVTELTFVPEQAKIGYGGSFIIMNSGSSFATLDMEAMKLVEWSTDSTIHGWLNTHMLYSVNNGKLYVYDFDGLNRRELAANVSGRFPATITDDKWLYYFSDDTIIRERISD